MGKRSRWLTEDSKDGTSVLKQLVVISRSTVGEHALINGTALFSALPLCQHMP